jgi:hypothetical protein
MGLHSTMKICYKVLLTEACEEITEFFTDTSLKSSEDIHKRFSDQCLGLSERKHFKCDFAKASLVTI